jgi:integrase/recombinase XerD
MTDSRPDQTGEETDPPEVGNTGGALTVPDPPAPPSSSALVVPRVIADLGEAATLRFVDFFTANIRNVNTRAAYAVAIRGFFQWLEKHGPADLAGIRTHHVSTYIELLATKYRAPTVKQHLAAIRMLFDFLIVGQVVGQNPAAAVRGPKHVVKKGKTPVLDGDEAKKLLDSIDTSTIVGLRDRALIGLLIYSFARISAALHMNVRIPVILNAHSVRS